jgi:hypothetical protein
MSQFINVIIVLLAVVVGVVIIRGGRVLAYSDEGMKI